MKHIGVGGSWIVGVPVVDSVEFCSIYFLLLTIGLMIIKFYKLFQKVKITKAEISSILRV